MHTAMGSTSSSLTSREAPERVDKLCAELEAEGIPYWREINALVPGDYDADTHRIEMASQDHPKFSHGLQFM